MASCITFFLLFLVKGKPTTIFTSIYVESFGNIEEANMVCELNFMSRRHDEFVNSFSVRE